jgi:hypothetical protein
MKRILALALVVSLVALGVPTSAFAAGPRVNSSVAGMAKDSTGKPLANATVRLRNVLTGKLAGSTRTSIAGSFTFENLASGNYVVESLNSAGRVMAASASVDVAPGAAVTGVAVTAPAEAGAQGGAAAAGGGSFFTSTTGIIVLAAIGAGVVTGIVLATGDDDTSPKK